ncbi:MAG: hypothetical protein AB7V32_06470 [Candidatus Berkiella sp.]
MKTRKLVLLAILTTLFAFSSPGFAYSKGGCHDGGGSSGGMGDNTRERGDPSARSRGEQNHDNDTQGAEAASASQTGQGTHISDIGRGSPKDTNHSFNSTSEETMNHR